MTTHYYPLFFLFLVTQGIAIAVDYVGGIDYVLLENDPAQRILNSVENLTVPFPSARRFGSFNLLPNTEFFVLFGGERESTVFLGDTWIFDRVSLSWSKIVPAGSSPRPRSWACSGYVGDDLFYFGGQISTSWEIGSFLNEVWAFSSSDLDWHRVYFDAVVPYRRAGCSFWSLRGESHFFSFFGRDVNGASSDPLLDFERISTDSFNMTLSVPTTRTGEGGHPGARWGALTWTDYCSTGARRLYAYSGYYSTSLIMLDRDTLTWSNIDQGSGPDYVGGTTPGSRKYSAVAGIDDFDVVFYGGVFNYDATEMYGDVWSYSSHFEEWKFLKIENDDVVVDDPVDYLTSGSLNPGARVGAVAASYKVQAGVYEVYIFGGGMHLSTDVRNDLWMLSLPLQIPNEDPSHVCDVNSSKSAGGIAALVLLVVCFCLW